MTRDLRIEQVDNGFVLRAWKSKPGEIYDGESFEAVAATKADVKEYVSQWLEEQAPPFKKPE